MYKLDNISIIYIYNIMYIKGFLNIQGGEFMKRIILLLGLLLFSIFLIGCIDCKVYVNKDNKELKELKKEELQNIIDKYSSSIVDELEVGNTKIVGFSNDSTQGVVVYEKDSDGNYVINQTNELDTDELGISNFRIIYKNYSDINNAEYGYVFISNGTKVSRVEITINEKYKYIKNIKLGQPSMVLIKEKIPSEENTAICLEIKYFDKDNNELSK